MSRFKSIVIPSCYLGPVSYFACMLQADEVWLEIHEHYIKQTYRNRCSIATANGQLNLIIPVIKVNGNHTRMHDVEISNSERWQMNHWRAIESAYSNAPFFLFYKSELESFYSTPFSSLIEYNQGLLEIVLSMLKVKINIQTTSRYDDSAGVEMLDFRQSIQPKKKQGMIIPPYPQVFSERSGFLPDLSVVDLLFNLGPDAKSYLMELSIE